MKSRQSQLSFFLLGAMLAPLFTSGAQSTAQSLDGLMQPIEGRSMRSSSARLKDGEPDPDANRDNYTIKPGDTHVLLEAEGPGVVTHIWCTFLGPHPHNWAKEGSANHQEMLLRIYYDGNERPGVEAPVGDFFANAFGKRAEVVSVPVVVEDADSYNCFWRMPFKKSIRIEIVNQSKKQISMLYYNVDWIKKESLPEETPYFYAQYRQEYPVKKGEDYVILETEGKGHYVGTVLSVRTRSPAWFGEGDEKIYIDGEEKASIWGTGTEDYFLSAWGLKTVSTPYFGTPIFDQRGVGGHTSSYRWHIEDPIVFNTGIKVAIEHFGWMSPDETPDFRSHSWNEREDDYSSVAFWYQTGEPTFTARAPSAEERALPDLDKHVVFATKLEEVKKGEGSVKRQDTLSYPEGHLLYKPESAEGAWLEIPFTVKEKKPYRLVLRATRSYDFGRYRATLNGVPVGGMLDFYSPQSDTWDYQLLDFWPEPGEYTLRLECIGKNSDSSNVWAGIEAVRLRGRRPRVEKWGHDKDKDWREKPVLYR